MGLPPSTICHAGSDGGFFLPLFSNEVEETWPRWLRALLYLLGLLYAFIGVGELSDVFMESIETITSQERERTIKDERGNTVTIREKVWNGTVASLTLMALGSSAPEILLNVVEVVGNGFFAGDLGPSTIVGSAAFNFLIIIAVCIIAIPDGESRRIRSLSTFIVTTVFSLFAYSCGARARAPARAALAPPGHRYARLTPCPWPTRLCRCQLDVHRHLGVDPRRHHNLRGCHHCALPAAPRALRLPGGHWRVWRE